MTAPDSIVEDSHQSLTEVVQLLHQACEQTWQGTAPKSPSISLGLGIYLVYAQVSTLLPEHYQVRDVAADDRTVVQLLRDAEHCTRIMPLHRPEMAEISDLVVSLCDLIREASPRGR